VYTMSTRTIYGIGLFATMLCLAACVKDQEDVAQAAGITPSTCGIAGTRLQATVDGASYCANAQVIATSDGSTAMVTGVDLLGSSIILQLDTLAIGAFPMNEMENSALYMHTGTAFVMDPAHPGTLTITEHDTTTHSLKAAFEVILLNDLNGSTRVLNGDFDVTYTVDQ
ncbi:MAG: hypothetical protein ABI432_16660, partial [Flavobacteriales bacterium]